MLRNRSQSCGGRACWPKRKLVGKEVSQQWIANNRIDVVRHNNSLQDRDNRDVVRGLSSGHRMDDSIFPLSWYPGATQGKAVKSGKPARAVWCKDTEVPGWSGRHRAQKAENSGDVLLHQLLSIQVCGQLPGQLLVRGVCWYICIVGVGTLNRKARFVLFLLATSDSFDSHP